MVERDGGGRVEGEVEVEGEGLGAELAEQPLLQPGGRRLPGGREHLHLVQRQLLLETQPQRLLILSPVSTCAILVRHKLEEFNLSRKWQTDAHN